MNVFLFPFLLLTASIFTCVQFLSSGVLIFLFYYSLRNSLHRLLITRLWELHYVLKKELPREWTTDARHLLSLVYTGILEIIIRNALPSCPHKERVLAQQLLNKDLLAAAFLPTLVLIRAFCYLCMRCKHMYVLQDRRLQQNVQTYWIRRTLPSFSLSLHGGSIILKSVSLAV